MIKKQFWLIQINYSLNPSKLSFRIFFKKWSLVMDAHLMLTCYEFSHQYSLCNHSVHFHLHRRRSFHVVTLSLVLEEVVVVGEGEGVILWYTCPSLHIWMSFCSTVQCHTFRTHCTSLHTVLPLICHRSCSSRIDPIQLCNHDHNDNSDGYNGYRFLYILF